MPNGQCERSEPAAADARIQDEQNGWFGSAPDCGGTRGHPAHLLYLYAHERVSGPKESPGQVGFKI